MFAAAIAFSAISLPGGLWQCRVAYEICLFVLYAYLVWLKRLVECRYSVHRHGCKWIPAAHREFCSGLGCALGVPVYIHIHTHRLFGSKSPEKCVVASCVLMLLGIDLAQPRWGMRQAGSDSDVWYQSSFRCSRICSSLADCGSVHFL